MLKYVSLIVLYFLVVSSYFAYVIYEETQTEIEGIDGVIYQGGNIDFSGVIDLETITNLQTGSIEMLDWYMLDGKLIYDGGILSSSDEPLMFPGIRPNDEGIYDVIYNINNTENLNFEIWLTRGGISDGHSYIIEYNSDNKEIIIYKPYVHTVIGEFFREELYKTTVNFDGIKSIQTLLDTNNKMITIIYNGDTFSFPAELEKSYDYYAGIRITEAGHFEINSLKSRIILTENDGMDNSFLGILSTLIIWNVDEKYLPPLMNVILIKFPGLVLIMASAFYLRGTQ